MEEPTKPQQSDAQAPATTEGDVKAPNLLEKAQKEIDANDSSLLEKTKGGIEAKKTNLLEKTKEEIETIIHTEQAAKREIDETTPVEDAKAPNLLERATEEVEALVRTVPPKVSEQTCFHKGSWIRSSLGKLVGEDLLSGGQKGLINLSSSCKQDYEDMIVLYSQLKEIL